jgi:hypothetical protein
MRSTPQPPTPIELDVIWMVLDMEDHPGRWPHLRRNEDIPDAPERAKMHREPPFWENASRETSHQDGS